MFSKFKVIWIHPKAGRVTLQRYLVSKLVYDLEKFGARDLLCLFENQLWLEHEAQTNENFLDEFGKSLEVLSKHLKEVNFRMDPSDRAFRRLQMRMKAELPKFYYPQRNYTTVGQRYEKLFQLQDPVQPGRENKSLKPSRRIGKGYTDKGTLKNVATNGTPSWQEVAAHHGPIYSKGVPDVQITLDEGVEKSAVKLLRLVRELEEAILKGSSD